MEQKNLNFSQNQTLEGYLEAMLAIELNSSAPFNYQEERTEQVFINLLTVLCGGANNYTSNRREKIVYHVNAFDDKLTHEQWGKFHYDMCIAITDKLDTFNLDIIEKYESTFNVDKWNKYIVERHGLNFEEVKSVGYSGYIERPKGAYYRDTSSFTSLKLEEQERMDELLKARFLDIAVNNFSKQSFKNKCSAISFFIKKGQSEKQLKYLEPEEIIKLISSMAQEIGFEQFIRANDYGNRNYYEVQANKSLMSALYDEIFASPVFSLEQKNIILYDVLKIEKNYFYSDYNKICQIIRDGSVQENIQMFDLISFPLKTSYQAFSNEKEMVLNLCDASRLQVGRGIKIAAWFLDMCEKDFEKGKFLFEKFLPAIKEEMLLDKKTNEQENINFLLAYANKKGKNSITIKNKVAVVQQAMAQLEKEQLSATLQMDLFDNSAPIITKKFKL